MIFEVGFCEALLVIVDHFEEFAHDHRERPMKMPGCSLSDALHRPADVTARLSHGHIVKHE